jgi:uncharacterized protein (DUF1501 family)
MIDPDITTERARALLSRPADDGPAGPDGWTRRRFLQMIGAGALGGAALGPGGLASGLLGFDVPDAWAGTPIGPTDGILVTIMLYGGNDGLNTVVPYTDSRYYTQRGRVAIAADQVLPLDGTFGLHPSLGYVRSLWDAGELAIVHGSGYPNPDLSHFTSMGIWMNGRFGGGAPTTGWIGRWLDGQPSATADLAAATLGQSVPLHLVGATRRALAIPTWGGLFGTDSQPSDLRMYTGLQAFSAAPADRGQWHDMYAATLRAEIALAREIAPVFTPAPTGDGLVRDLTVAARLINADIGLRVIDLGLDGFDNHDSQPWRHGDLLAELDAGLRAFFAALAPAFRNRVTVLTMSEFGRTPFANGSTGTDHGTANVQFVIGANVRGGHHGQHPSLAMTSQWDRLVSTVDFRSVLGTVIDGWMGGGGSTILNGSYSPLDLFRAGPGPGSGTAPTLPPIVLPPAAPCAFVPLVPQRLFDTRNGVGGRRAALGRQETWTFPLGSVAGLPADATAVALNVTAVDATAPTFVTVWPGGTARPTTSNLNPSNAAAVPNLVVVRLGGANGVSFFNNAGSVHLIADLAGYFTEQGGVTMEPLVPARLLDTRDGTGGQLGPLGQGRSIDLQVAGRGGVSATCRAVALNVTVTEPTATSYISVWPTGSPRPDTSCVNMRAGQTVPNMVVARVGAEGKISLFNAGGSTHLIVDVLGCFDDGAAGKFVPMAPARVLDTRDGTGARRGPVTGEPLALLLRGVQGIPADGVRAVLLNVTAVQPTQRTYVTIYPSGTPLPTASNLNVEVGQVVPNAVLARLGDDGKVMCYNAAGAIDLVADVMGYVTG